MNDFEIVVFNDDNLSLEVNIDKDTVWFTQEQLTELFDSSKQNISAYK